MTIVMMHGGAAELIDMLDCMNIVMMLGGGDELIEMLDCMNIVMMSRWMTRSTRECG